jgi:hypothetical protein
MKNYPFYVKNWQDISKPSYLVIPGISFGGQLKILKENKKFFLCSVPGYTGWIHLGSVGYHYPKYVLVQKVKINDNASIEESGSFYKTFKYSRNTKKEILANVMAIFNGEK